VLRVIIMQSIQKIATI